MAVHHYNNTEYNVISTLIGGAMADIDYMQTVNIMKAASPYFDTRTRRLVDFIAKALDALYSFQKLRLPIDVATQDSANHKFDLEGLLNGIRPHCNDRLRSMVDQILGIFRAKKMYETFQSYSNIMNMMQGSNHSESDSESSSNNNNSGFDLSALFGSGLGGNLGNFSVSDIQNMAKAFQFNNMNGNENNNVASNDDSTDVATDENEENSDSSNSLSRIIADLTQLVNSSSENTKETLVSDHEKSEDTDIEHNKLNGFNEFKKLNEHKDSVIEVDFSTGTKSTKSSNSKHPYFYETLEASGALNSENFPGYMEDIDTSDYQEQTDQMEYEDYGSMGEFDEGYTTNQNIEGNSFAPHEDNTSDITPVINQDYINNKINNNDTDRKNNSNNNSNHGFINTNIDNNSNNDSNGSSNGTSNNRSNNSTDINTNNSGNNDNVIDLLKTMVPPEQMSTFENLSMLFKAMSYDYNNKNQK